VQLNRRDGEIGVVLGAPVDVSKAATGGLGKVSWFLPHELVPASAQNHPDSRSERAIGASEASARRRPQSERT
jgi:hypothetical protein